MTRWHLTLLRHADAGDPLAWPGPDEARPLSPKGIRQSERLGEHLARIRFAPDLLLSSPKVRARETADRIAAALRLTVVIERRLAGPLSIDVVAAILAQHGGARDAVLVGHDPDFSDLASELSGTDMPLKKGALVRFEVDGDLASGLARPRWLLPPDAIAA